MLTLTSLVPAFTRAALSSGGHVPGPPWTESLSGLFSLSEGLDASGVSGLFCGSLGLCGAPSHPTLVSA